MTLVEQSFVCAFFMSVKEGQTAGGSASASPPPSPPPPAPTAAAATGGAAEACRGASVALSPPPALRLVPGVRSHVRSHERAEADARANEDREQEGRIYESPRFSMTVTKAPSRRLDAMSYR